MAHEEPDPMSGESLDWLEEQGSIADAVDEDQLEDAAAEAYLAADDEYVPMDDGTGFLLVGGAEGGSIVSALPSGSILAASSAAPAVTGRDEALSGRLPILLVHRGGRHGDLLPLVMGQLHHQYGRSMAVGTVANLPAVKDEKLRSFFAQSSVASLRIADPQCYRLDGEVLRLEKEPIGKRAWEYAPYLASPEAADWEQRVLDAQRQVNASLLLTPGRALDPDDPQGSLDSMFQSADKALASMEQGERLALNVTIPSRWLTSEVLRNRLLDEILDQDHFDVLYVRTQWSQGKAFTPTEDAALLVGLKKLANLCQDEERSLLLPQTGLTGWFALAHGATGFGLGISGSDQCFAEYVFRRGRPGQLPAQRYFERQMLHTVDRASHDVAKSIPGYTQCECAYCADLLRNEPWSHVLSALHHLYSMGALTAKVHDESARPGGRHAAVRRIVAAAKKWTSGLPLGTSDLPRHLAAWDQAL
ncbi:hypothetical protein ACFXA4_26520 [Streptomyces sp. NPDC059442]|uniref:hypothetical protein n=1 Tax=Streptomyces sp. NPDC059442 TaxID=3346830 RepID=UPI00368E21DB